MWRFLLDSISSRSRISGLLYFCCVFSAWLQPAAALAEPVCDDRRIVAMSDVHGAFDAMVETLHRADVLGEADEWTGGCSQLVIVGDILDRGPRSRDAMELLMRLEEEAESAGGRVEVLIGNHESMLLTGDMRYVSDEEYRAFAAEETAPERAEWLQRYAERRGAAIAEVQATFEKNYPPGYFAMRRAFRSDGRYGAWLLQKDAVAKLDGSVFVHGGLSEKIARLGIAGINTRLRGELTEYVKALDVLIDAAIILPTDSHYDYASILNNYLPSLDASSTVIEATATLRERLESSLFDVTGPLWNRSNVSCQGIVEEYRIRNVLEALDAERLVVGHTPTPGRDVLQRFDGRVVEIDTGMLNSWYKGSGNALVIDGDTLRVVAQSADEVSAPRDRARQVGRRAQALSAERMEELLRTGEIVSIQKNRQKLTQPKPAVLVTVTDGENTVDAVFSKRRNKGVYPSVAAYRLDRLLNLEMVPVTVIREVNGAAGSLQFLPAGLVPEADRAARGDGGGARCSLRDQWPAMAVFDTLIYNEGRSSHRILYDPKTWRLILSEHFRSFAASRGRPPHLKYEELIVHAGWQKALKSLSNERLSEELGDVLDKRRLKALFGRRDELLKRERHPGLR